MERSKDPNQRNPETTAIGSAARAFLNKRGAMSEIMPLRDKLLATARRLYTNTIRLNGLVDDPDFIDKLNTLSGHGKMQGYWASRLLSLPLLSSAIWQLSKAETAHDLLLAIVRLVGIVEDAEDPVETPRPSGVTGTVKPNYHQTYKYLMKTAGWPTDKVKQFDADLSLFTDQLVSKMAALIKGGKNRLNTTPRPKGW